MAQHVCIHLPHPPMTTDWRCVGGDSVSCRLLGLLTRNLHFLSRNISHCEGTPACPVSPWRISNPIAFWAGLHVAMTSFVRVTHERKVNAWFDAKVRIRKAS